jgi:hypothetical protein
MLQLVGIQLALRKLEKQEIGFKSEMSEML